MRRSLAMDFLLLALCGTSGTWAGNGVGNGNAGICVRLFDSDRVGGMSLPTAESVAGRILASAGIGVRWDDNDSALRSTVCRAKDASGVPLRTIDVRILYSTPPDLNPGSLAISRPFARQGVRITVFFDRVDELGKRDQFFTPRILGHVLAHEIGHVLQGTNTHSATGVMKAHWSDRDCARMRAKLLAFTRDDVEAMRSGLRLDHPRFH